MADSIINSKDPKKADAVVLGVDFHEMHGGGAEKRPEFSYEDIIEYLDTSLEFYDRYTRNEPAMMFKTAHVGLKSLGGKSIENVIEKLKKEYGKYKTKENFLVLLGGSHSLSIGPFQYFAEKEKASDITVIQIDAHPDMRDDDSDYNDEHPGKFNHSCVMRRAFDLGFPLVQVGLRTGSVDEWEFIEEKKIPAFEWGKKKNHSIGSILKAVKTKKVYLTIDLDGLDPAHAPSVGTPLPGGLEWNYATRLVREIFKKFEVVGADILEFCPDEYDLLTAHSAAQLCYNVISYKLLKDQGKLKFFE